jgi:hypothetical protein
VVLPITDDVAQARVDAPDRRDIDLQYADAEHKLTRPPRARSPVAERLPTTEELPWDGTDQEMLEALRNVVVYKDEAGNVISERRAKQLQQSDWRASKGDAFWASPEEVRANKEKAKEVYARLEFMSPDQRVKALQKLGPMESYATSLSKYHAAQRARRELAEHQTFAPAMVSKDDKRYRRMLKVARAEQDGDILPAASHEAVMLNPEA